MQTKRKGDRINQAALKEATTLVSVEVEGRREVRANSTHGAVCAVFRGKNRKAKAAALIEKEGKGA